MFVYALLTIVSGTSATPNLGVLPYPRSVHYSRGVFRLDKPLRLLVDVAANSIGTTLKNDLTRLVKARFAVKSIAGASEIQIKIEPTRSELGKEGYRLDIKPNRLSIVATQPSGAFYATRSLYQIVQDFGSRVPCMTIVDQPRFGWRGTHIDVARHYMPISFLRRLIDQMSMVKMNVLHLHLTDDQGWRMEIKRYPKLVSIGSRRSDTQTNDAPDEFTGKPHEGHYTQQELRDLVDYAKARFVDIMPEIEMPGHCQAAIASYPELGNTGIPVPVATGWGVHVDVLNVEDSTVQFFKNVLDEVVQVFPFGYVHIGGDEVPTDQWKQSPQAQQKMRSLGFKSESQLQGWFMQQIADHLKLRGRKVVGWDEMLETGAPQGSTLMSWRGFEPGKRAATQGHDVIMSPASWAYFDQSQTRDKKQELPRSWGHLSLERLSRFHPIPEDLDLKSQNRILGAQSALWTEVIPDAKTAEYMLYPRLFVFADRVWNPRTIVDYNRYREILVQHTKRLDTLGISHHAVEPAPDQLVGTWTSSTSSTKLHSIEVDLTSAISTAGDYTVTFEYTGGDHRLDIDECSLIANGETVWTDAHKGSAGASSIENSYRLRVSKHKRNTRYLLRASVHSDGGSDSNGDIRIHKVK